MKGLKLLLIAAIALVCTSCGGDLSEKISIESCDNVELIGFTGLKADFGFRNESGRNITLQAITLTLKSGSKSIGKLDLREEFMIPRRSSLVEIPTLWKLHQVNILAAISASKKITAGETDSFKVDVVARVKSGLFKRTFEFKDLSLSQLQKSMK